MKTINVNRRLLCIVLMLCLLPVSVIASDWEYEKVFKDERKIGIYTNALYWGALVPNLGVEMPLARQWSIDVQGLYAPWTFTKGRRYRIGGLQPEIKWWPCQVMKRHHIGAHFHYAKYNIANIALRRQGDLIGGGISYGYVWQIDKRWNIDFAVGVGYARLRYDKYGQQCNLVLEERGRNYWGPTQAAIKFVYKIPY